MTDLSRWFSLPFSLSGSRSSSRRARRRRFRLVGLSAALLAGALGCTLGGNPRLDEDRGPGEQRRSTAELLAADGDLTADWDDQRSLDLRDGVEWAKIVGGRTLGGALLRMLSVDESPPAEVPVVGADQVVADPRVSGDNAWLAYHTAPSDPTRRRGDELWVAALPPPGRVNAAGLPRPFRIERDGSDRHFCWSPMSGRFAYFQTISRRLVVGEVFRDTAEDAVKVRILHQVAASESAVEAERLAWTADGRNLLTIWSTADEGRGAWILELGAGRLVEANIPWGASQGLRPELLDLIPCPIASRAGQVLVEARRQGGRDEDLRVVALWSLTSGELEELPGLSGHRLAPRWCGRSRFASSKLRAGVTRSRGSRWDSWQISIHSTAMARGRSQAQPTVLPFDLAALDWNQNSDDMDRQLAWLVNGEVCVFIDPDTGRNVRLTDHSGANRLELLRNRDRQTPRILSIQVVSVPDGPGRTRDFLYFLEDLRGANLKRIEITPLGIH